MCPLCKSIGNALLPIIWPGRTEYVNWKGCKISENRDDSDLIISLCNFVEEDLTHLNIPSMFQSKDLLDSTFPSTSKLQKMFIPSMPGEFVSQELLSIRKFYSTHLYPNLKLKSSRKYGNETPSQNEMSITRALFDTFYSTVCVSEISSRGATPIWQPTSESLVASQLIKVGVLDCINQSILNTLKLLSETCISSLFLQENVYSSGLTAECNNFLLSMLCDKDASKSSLLSITPLMLKDGFEHLISASMILFPCLKLEKEKIFCFIRIFAVFEGLMY